MEVPPNADDARLRAMARGPERARGAAAGPDADDAEVLGNDTAFVAADLGSGYADGFSRLSAAVTGAMLGSTKPQHDGRGVYREPVSKQMLEFFRPSLRGNLDPPEAGSPPPGVTVRTDDAGARVLTVNIHGGVPGSKHDRKAGDEDIKQLRDVARYINSIDPDVVLVQEVVNHPLLTWPGRVAEQASVLAHLMDADDMAFTPAFREFDGTLEGTAIYTRNGYSIDHAVNIELPDGNATQERGAGIAKVVAPDGVDYTVVGTHLAHLSTDTDARAAQLDRIANTLLDLEDDGEFSYIERHGGGHRTSGGFPTDRIILGGDLNSLQDNADGVRNSPDEILGDAGLVHTNTQLHASDDPRVRANLDDAEQRTSTKRRIDHVYTRGIGVLDATVAGVPNDELPEGQQVTDHRGIVVDLAPIDRA